MDWETMEAAKKFSEDQDAARRKAGERPLALIKELIDRLKEQLVDHRGTRGW
jgi:hypothetical protein